MEYNTSNTWDVIFVIYKIYIICTIQNNTHTHHSGLLNTKELHQYGLQIAIKCCTESEDFV